MENRKLTEEEIHKFLTGCENLMHLGTSFTGNIRIALSELRKTYDPVLQSNYLDKAVVELLTRSLNEFEKKIESNLDGINRICTRGSQWLVFYLGKSLGKNSEMPQQADQSFLNEDFKPPAASMESRSKLQGVKKMKV